MESIRIERLRCLTDTGDIAIKPVTVLVGQNSSGKSTFLRVFPLLKQSIDNLIKMLIKIDHSLVAKIENPGNPADWSPEIIMSLRNLATAKREGKHLVIAKKQTLEAILQCPSLDELTKEMYKKIREKTVNYMNSYIAAVSRYIEVIDSCPEPSLSKINNKEVISILTELLFIKDKQQALRLLESIDSSPVQEIRQFLDLKQGTSLDNITKNQEDKVKAFWQDKILENVIDWSEKTTPHKMAEKLNSSDPLRLEWEKLGQTVINWCLAEDPIRA